MTTRFWHFVLVLLSVNILAGCASVDQFGARVYDANINSQIALDQETLLNVLRASRYQNINFVAITQITGGQTEMLNTGFPTFTIGPHAQPTVITNSLTTGLSGGYQSNPLVSSQFEEGILSPITPRAIAQLFKSQLREPVLYAVVSQIRMTAFGKVHTFINDPSDDVIPSDLGKSCEEEFARWGTADVFRDDRECRYTKFVNFLDKLLEFGISAELKLPNDTGSGSVKAPTAKDEASTKGMLDASAAQSKITAANKDIAGPLRTGQYCFDPALATRFDKPLLLPVLSKQQCGEERSSRDKLVIPFDGAPVKIDAIESRSLAQVYSYLGKIEKSNLSDKVKYYTRSAIHLAEGDGKFLNIRHGIGPECSITVLFESQPYCVPFGADNTRMLFSILQQVRNLSIQPSDLNSAFTVRLSNE